MKDRLLFPKATDTHDARQVELADMLSKCKDAPFALLDSASRQIDRTFRRLSWSQIAVRLELEPDALDTDNFLPEVAVEVPGIQPDELSATDLPDELPPQSAEALSPIEVFPPTTTHRSDQTDPMERDLDETVIQSIRDEAYAEGLSAGKAITQSEREAELAAQFAQLQKLMVSLGSEQVFDMDVVARSIEDAVLTLASERIGIELTLMPEPLLTRLEGLLDNLAHLLGKREVFLSPEDIPLLQKCLDSHPNPPLIYLRGDPTMQRGDAKLRVGGAEVSDLLRDRATTLLRDNATELV